MYYAILIQGRRCTQVIFFHAQVYLFVQILHYQDFATVCTEVTRFEISARFVKFFRSSFFQKLNKAQLKFPHGPRNSLLGWQMFNQKHK